MSISDRLDEIESVAAYLDDDDMEAEVLAATAALRAVLAINTGDNRSLYGLDFEAGMCKALAIVHQTIAVALGGGIVTGMEHVIEKKETSDE